MARQGITTGSVPNDGTGDTLLSGAIKINENFSEVYGLIGDGTNAYVGIVTQIVAGSNISISTSYGSVTVTSTASGGGESYWAQNATGINTTSNVGIGTTTASSALTVKGNTSLETLNVSGVSTFSGAIDANSTANFQGDVTLQSNLIFGDNDEIQLGAASGGDLLITHLSSTNNSLIRNKNTSGSFIIDTATGSPIEIRHSSGGEPMGIFTPNGSVDLYYDNSKKFETLGAGVTVTGTTFTNQLSVSGVSTFSGDIKFSGTYGDNGALWDESEGALIFKDGRQIRLGDYDGSGGDLRIYHAADGSHSYIQDTGTGNLRIISGGDAIELLKDTTETMAKFNTDGSVELYYDNSKKFETLGAGVTVTGTTFTGQLSVSGVSTLGIVTATTYYGDTSNTVDGRWTLTGDGSNYTLSGIGITSGNNTDPILYFARGRVYEFVNTQPSSHPFVIRDSDGGIDWTAGITTSTDGTNDFLRFEVPMNAPNTLFYQCTVHSGMGNTISVYPTVS